MRKLQASKKRTVSGANQNRTASPSGKNKPTQRFSKKSRMTERAQFVRLFDNPDVYRGTAFQAFCKENETGRPRLGITIKGRLPSVWRMRMKRVIREWFRVAQPKLGVSDVNIVVRVPATLDRDFMTRLRQQLYKWKA